MTTKPKSIPSQGVHLKYPRLMPDRHCTHFVQLYRNQLPPNTLTSAAFRSLATCGRKSFGFKRVIFVIYVQKSRYEYKDRCSFQFSFFYQHIYTNPEDVCIHFFTSTRVLIKKMSTERYSSNTARLDVVVVVSKLWRFEPN